MTDIPITLPYSDYIQSANTLFHFMTESAYLESILKNRAIIPRYCIENIEYLNIRVREQKFTKIAILQKCFCDIPFHKLADTFEVQGAGQNFNKLDDREKKELTTRNSHPDYYGKFAIAFSKKWGEDHHLQPVQYVNEGSAYAMELSEMLSSVISAENLPDIYANDVLRRLSYIKPLRGTMSRTFKRKKDEQKKDERKKDELLKVELIKNFHDEREWRYVPSSDDLSEAKIEGIIANPNILTLLDGIFGIDLNQIIESEHYRKLWLEFSYDDVRYIIVPDTQARIEIIDTILSIPNSQFIKPEQALCEKHILISKILVLDEIRKDW